MMGRMLISSLFGLLLISSPLLLGTALAAPLANGQAAEKAGRYSEALRFYTALLQNSKIIAVPVR